MVKNVYLFSGKAQAGKDFVSGKLKDTLERKGYKVLKLGFADALKNYVSTLFGVSVEEVERLKLCETPFTQNGLTMRQILQRMGTELFRDKIDYDYWVKVVSKIMSETDYDYYLISDYRFPNERRVAEYASLCDKSTYVVKTVRVLNNDVIQSNAHISENMLTNDCDIVIDNTDHSYVFNISDFII